MAEFVRVFAADESGATAIEYALIVSLIFLAIIVSIQGLSGALVATYALIASAM
ncbi:MAG: Flp family type IVb pilin [Micropepsaceae bacterium]